ncbi:MAG: isopentenyl phosphate kinase [Thermoplasmata archaeon]
MILIKLGGSVLTDKRKKYSFKTRIAKRLLKEIKESEVEDYIIVHGGGSFGHPGAKEYSINESEAEPTPEGISRVQLDMRRMNNRLLELMHELDMWGISIPGGLVTLFKAGELETIDEEIFERYLDIDTIPVTFGDVAVDREEGMTICSGDDIALGLSKMVHKVIFVSDVDGIYKKGEVVKEFTHEMFPLSPKDLPKGREGIDVTGGMNQKVKKMLDISKHCETYLMNGESSDRLRSLLEGENVLSTEVKA